MKLRSKAANRYAQALLTLASESGEELRVGEDLAFIARALSQSPELADFTQDTLLPKTARHRALAALFMDRVHPLTWKFLQLLEEKRRLGLLAAICPAFRERDDIRRGIAHGVMLSASPAPTVDVDAMAGHFGALLGKTVLLRAGESPALLGGCRVQVGDLVYDFSLAARLRLAQNALTGA